MKNEITKAADFIGKKIEVTVDRPLNSEHPKFGWPYKLNYGYIENTMSPDGEELDAYIIGIEEPTEKFTGTCVAFIHRTNDDDDKLIVTTDDKREISDDEIRELTNFQEKFFESKIVRS